jgi:phage terminase large subunit-like protein
MAAKRKPKVAAPAPNIITAMDDPQMFGKFFPGESWDGWKTLLKATFGLPLTENETDFFKSVAGDRLAPTQAVRELWAVVGRRGGKDSVASAIAAFVAANFNQQDKLRPGERAVVACIAVDRDQAKVILNYVRSFFVEIPLLAGMLQRETQFGFELTNNVDITIITNNFRSIRGRAVLLAIFDEVAFYRDDASSAPDIELYNAITPSLASLAPGSMIVGISSPYRKSGLLYNKYRQHFGQDGDVLVIQAPTRTLNPTISQELIDREVAEDPAAKRAEYLAEWRDDIAGYIGLEVLEAAVDNGVTLRPPSLMADYVAFADPSGGKIDSFTAAIAHDDSGTAVLDCVVEVKAPMSTSEAVAQISDVIKAYGLTSITGDRFAAQFTIDAFAACGITYHQSERDRSTIYTDILPMLMSGRVRLLDDPIMVRQFAGLERKSSPGGRDKIDHARGGHDDIANAAAGALTLATGKSKQSTFLFGSVSWT